MDASSAVAISPSDEKLWSALRSRVETILEGRKRLFDWSSYSTCSAESRRGKRIREDSLLLIRGLDSVASSLSHLKETLDDASQEAENLVQPSLTDELRSEEKTSRETLRSDEREDNRATTEEGEQKTAYDGTLKKAKNLAVCMLTKATSLARELKAVKSQLGFMQERCSLLEEENRRIRNGVEKGSTQDEDDLVRLQMEALLAEKSRLAHENANLMRENQRLQQLVEYHQLTAQDLAETYGDIFQGVCLDFSSDLEDDSSEDQNQSAAL